MLRLAPKGYLRFPQADSFCINYTGAEANMSVALSYMGIPSKIVTKLPNNDIGRAAARKMMMYGVNTADIIFGGKRIGVYYLEKGASQRPSKIIYDRADSAISTAEPEEFDWDRIMETAAWFHFTGITAGLSPNAAKSCLNACIAAKKNNVTVSCDLNYRKSLWSPEDARKVMEPLMQYVNVLVANEEDSEKCLGIKAEGSDVYSGKLSVEGYSRLGRELISRYGLSRVAFTLRESISASDNNWSAMLCSKESVLVSKKYRIHLVDRVGGGDSFASGLIYGYLKNMTDAEALEYATAASCLKQTIEMDFNLSTEEEVMSLINGNGSGRVQR